MTEADVLLLNELSPIYKDSTILAKLQHQKEQGIKPTALATDFDNSFFSPETQHTTHLVSELSEKYNIPIIVATGNDASGLINKINTQINPNRPEDTIALPDIVIGATGTEVWIKQINADHTGPEYKQDEEFITLINQLGFNRHSLSVQAHEAIQSWKNQPEHNYWKLDFQHPEGESAFIHQPKQVDTIQPYKLSFYYYASDEDRDIVSTSLSERINGNYIISVCEEIGYNKEHADEIAKGAVKKFCLDILPVEPKAFATNYVINKLGIKRTLNAGDSGNDIGFLRKTDIGMGVVVGGAKPELAREVLKSVSEAKPAISTPTGFEKVTTETGNKHIFVASQTAAGGILDAALQYLQMINKIDPDPRIDQAIEEIRSIQQ